MIDICHLSLLILLADFISGVIHWLEDTYFYPGIFKGILDKSVVKPNMYHHKKPADIINGTYLQTNIVSILITGGIGLLLYLLNLGTVDIYILLMVLSHSNQIHKWAHDPRPPEVIKGLQTLGILQSLKHHGIHHRYPYDKNYCVLTNYLNPLLDGIGFWRLLELTLGRLGVTVKRNTTLREGL